MAKRTSNVALQVEYVETTNKIRTSDLALQVEYVDTLNKIRTSNMVLMVEYTLGGPPSPPSTSNYGPKIQMMM